MRPLQCLFPLVHSQPMEGSARGTLQDLPVSYKNTKARLLCQTCLKSILYLMAKKRQNRKRQITFNFGKSLVLFQYIMSLFEANSLGDLCEGMKAPQLEGFDEYNVSRFHNHLVNELFERQALPNDMLLEYDQNIASHTLRISGRREGFRWKYFQYMALLFTEIYLDKYFQNTEKFLKNLNDFVTQFNRDKEPDEHVATYKPEDLNKIAFWQATGSGKTLIMHVNILQHHHYLKKYNRQGKVNRVILLTPNEGLSEQHRKEFWLSGLDAELFNKDAMGLFRSNAIEIIDVHKLREESGEKTVGVDCFEGNNLVLVDEGHRGAGGAEWMDKRNRLCEQGFSFEYSATFGQAMKASGKKDMLQQYAKCIVFDYSYKYFYRDGYGKEYSILNLAEDRYEEQRNLYLAACLLTFYQQLLIYNEYEREFFPFLLEEPLWVFVGSKVNAVRKERGCKVSDVVDILLFLDRFLKNTRQSIDYIQRLLTGTSQLNDTKGNDLFAGRFTYLKESCERSILPLSTMIRFILNYKNIRTNVPIIISILKKTYCRFYWNGWIGMYSIFPRKSFYLIRLIRCNYGKTSQ